MSLPTALTTTDDPPRERGETPLERQVVAPPVAPAVTWQGRYVLGEKLGESGTSIVHEAHDLLLGRTVALKELSDAALPHATVLAREARALGAVDHPNVVRVHSVYPDARPAFLVMERVRGRPLSELSAGRRLPIPIVLSLLRQIAAGIDGLHAAGIVHGDVKPANVLVDEKGIAKLIDVALGTLLDRARPGEIVGTPSYVAPERAHGDANAPAIRAPGDVYSFGVLCFELLTGRLPFSATCIEDALRAHVAQRPPMPSSCAGLSTEFDAPIASALAKSPERRPASCTELVLALERASKGCDLNGKRLRVLVADDDHDQRLMLMSMLGAHLPGASIVLCGTGASVLEALASQPTSVAVLDLAMPEPSGLDLVQQVRTLAPSTPVVIVTGRGSGHERRHARGLGVRRFLVKPFELDELVLAIRDVVEGDPPSWAEVTSAGASR